MPTQRPVARQRPPDIFESLMSVEKVRAVEEVEACFEFRVAGRDGHSKVRVTGFASSGWR